MARKGETARGTLRTAELLSPLVLAGDLGRGQPFGHVLRTCLLSMAIGRRLDLGETELINLYCTALLVHAGCTAGTPEFAAFIATDEFEANRDYCLCDPTSLSDMLGWIRRNVAPASPMPVRIRRALELITQRDGAMAELGAGCSDVGAGVARRLGIPQDAAEALFHICETWNGSGPHRLKHTAIPAATRVVNLAMSVDVIAGELGEESARAAARRRRGRAFDPDAVDVYLSLDTADQPWRDEDEDGLWVRVLDEEPDWPGRAWPETAIDEVAAAIADITDLKTPHAPIHSRAVAQLGERIARRLGLPADDVILVRRAGLVHDAGRLGTPTFALNGPQEPGSVARAQLHLHPYYTQRIFSRSPAFAALATIASMHHESPDGRGYPAGLTASAIPLPARVLATAEAYRDLLEGSPGGNGLSRSDAVAAMTAAPAGRYDRECLAALEQVVATEPDRPGAGRGGWPAGLSDREVEVLRLLAGGMSSPAIAKRLVLSHHTVRHHVEHIYDKVGVASRAGAVMFAAEHGMLLD